MEKCVILVKHKIEKLAEYLIFAKNQLEQSGRNVSITEHDIDDYHCFEFALYDDNEYIMDFYRILIKALAQYIMDYRRTDIVDRLIDSKLTFLDGESIGVVKERMVGNYDNPEFYMKCRSLIILSLVSYIINCHHLNIEGFITFRMREFWKYMGITIVDILEQYDTELLINDLIQLMAYYFDKE